MRVLLFILFCPMLAFAQPPNCSPIGQFVRFGRLTYTTIDFLSGKKRVHPIRTAEINTKKCVDQKAQLNAEGTIKLGEFTAAATPGFVFVYKNENSPACLTGVNSEEDILSKQWLLENDRCSDEPNHLVLVKSSDGAFAFYATLETAQELKARYPASQGKPKVVKIKKAKPTKPAAAPAAESKQ